jgi:hypothetical protein
MLFGVGEHVVVVAGWTEEVELVTERERRVR